MKICLAVVIAVVVIQMVNAQHESTLGIIPKKTTTVVTPTGPTCREVMCVVGCERVVGSDGCPFCDCQTNCTDVTCLVGYESEKAVVTCFQASGSESNTTCVPIANSTHCPIFQCRDHGPGCVAMVGPNGCPICECPVTCKDINCTIDEVCVLRGIVCKREPCLPQPTCVPRHVLCSGTPNTSVCSDSNDTQYRWSYNESTQTCQSFRYYGCTPSPNTFTSLKACEDKCKSLSVCGVCGEGCYRLRKDKATQCICPDPCKDINCTAGEVCRLEDAVCDKPPCNAPLKPSCVKDPCPEPEPCTLRCMKSLMMDDNGCQLCECCDQYIPGWVGLGGPIL